MEPPAKRQKTSRVEPRDEHTGDQPWFWSLPGRREETTPTPLLGRSDTDSMRLSLLERKIKHEAMSLQKKNAVKDQRRSRAKRDLDLDLDLNVGGLAVDLGLAADQPVLPSVPAVPQFPSGFGPPAVPALPSWTPVLPPSYPFAAVATSPVSTATSEPPTASGESTRTQDVTDTGLSSISTASPTNSLSSLTTQSLPNSISSIPTATSSVSGSDSSTTISDATSNHSLTGTNSPSTHSIATTSATATAGTTDTTATTGATALTTEGSSSSATGTPVDVGGGAQSSAGPVQSSSGDDSGPSTPQVVGGVVGGLAGFAMLTLLALLLLRWLKTRKRGGALQLGDGEGDNEDRGQLTMSERNNFMPPAAAAFFNRFSGASKETDVSTGERSFQRISGRKLPSVFSPGMSIDEARDLQNMSETTFYRDSQGTYGGPRSSTATGAATGAGATVVGLSPATEKETMMPSPARTPVIHESPYVFTPAGGPGTHTSGTSTLSAPISPHRLDPRFSRGGTLGRSHPSFDGSRGSRFTEDV